MSPLLYRLSYVTINRAMSISDFGNLPGEYLRGRPEDLKQPHPVKPDWVIDLARF